MTLEELTELAEGQPYLYLTIPRDRLPRGHRINLLGSYGPRGRICNVTEAERGYRVVAMFESDKVLKFLEKNS